MWYNDTDWTFMHFKYSKRPKSEHVRISDTGCLFGCKIVRTGVTSEIWTNLFGFQKFSGIRNPKVTVRTFGFRSIDGVLYINAEIRTFERPEMNRTFKIRTRLVRTQKCLDFSVVRIPNVRISDVDCIIIFVCSITSTRSKPCWQACQFRWKSSGSFAEPTTNCPRNTH